MSETFETAKERREGDRRSLPSGFIARYKPQILVCALVVALLVGGAYYSSRASESAPKTVYSTSLDEAKVEAQTPLLVNINTADARELDELPGVGPSTVENIIEHRHHKGSFKTVDELSSVGKYESKELRFRALLSEGKQEVCFERLAGG